MIEPTIWAKLHGASTHFPIALMLASTLCDGIALRCHDSETRWNFRFASAVMIGLAALGSYAAIATGLVITHGQLWGHDALLHHHQFVWPAFVLMTALATWRAVSPAELPRRWTVIQFSLMVLASLLVSGAGYWGGELLTRV